MQEGKVRRQADPGPTADRPAAKPFKYRDKGSMATIGHLSAVTDSFGMKFTGVIGYTMWGFVHVLYLIDWGNRMAAMYTWGRALAFTKNRGHRIITFEQARYELTQHAPHGEIPGGPRGYQE